MGTGIDALAITAKQRSTIDWYTHAVEARQSGAIRQGKHVMMICSNAWPLLTTRSLSAAHLVICLALCPMQSPHTVLLQARNQGNVAYDLRQRRVVGPFLIGTIVQAFLVGNLCCQYWALLTRVKTRPSCRLHIFLLALVILNVSNEAVTFAVRWDQHTSGRSAADLCRS